MLLLLLLTGCPSTEAPAPEVAAAGVTWTCPMHPSIHADHPGKCPLCGMDLVAINKDDPSVNLDEATRARVGVKTVSVAVRPLARDLRAAGTVAWDSTRANDVSLRIDAWVRTLDVAPGQAVSAGQRLVTVTAPELAATQRELLDAAAANDPATTDAARRRLSGWGIANDDIDAVLRAKNPSEALALRAPAAGIVLEGAASAGSMVTMGMPFVRIGRADKVWVEASLSPTEATTLRPGQPVRVELAEGDVDAKITSVLPDVDPTTRGQRFRITLDRSLPAGLFVPVVVPVDLGSRLSLPADAVIHAGERDLVFVDEGEGRITPHEVKLGVRAGEWQEVREGLKEGDLIVEGGAFLVAAESRLRSAGGWK